MSEARLNNLNPGDVALMKDLAEAAADTTVKRWLTAMGMDPDNPIASQQTYAAIRRIAACMDNEEAKADRQWTRRTRIRSEGIIGKVFLTSAGLVVVGAAHTLWAGLAAMLGKSG